MTSKIKYNPKILKPYLKAKYDNNTKVTNRELYSLCNACTDNEKGSIRALKSQFYEEFRNEINNESSIETNKNKKYKNVTSEIVKPIFHEDQSIESREVEIPNQHILVLIKKYPELPLFIYSKIFERVKPEYDEVYHKPHVANREGLTFSFFDLYIEIFDSINSKKLDVEIIEYMKDVITNFGNTHMLELENTKLSDLSQELLPNRNYSDYSFNLEFILQIIAEIIDYFKRDFTFNELKVKMLYYLLIKSNGYDNSLVSVFLECRSKDLIRSDILKLYILWIKSIQEEITINELYNEFDERYQDQLDLAEMGINYHGQYEHLFYIDKKGEKQYIESLERALIWEREGFEGLGKRGIMNLKYLTEESKPSWDSLFRRILKNKPDNYLKLISDFQEESIEDLKVRELENELYSIKNGIKNDYS